MTASIDLNMSVNIDCRKVVEVDAIFVPGSHCAVAHSGHTLGTLAACAISGMGRTGDQWDIVSRSTKNPFVSVIRMERDGIRWQLVSSTGHDCCATSALPTTAKERSAFLLTFPAPLRGSSSTK